MTKYLLKILLSLVFITNFFGCTYFKQASEYNLLKQDKKSIKRALNENYGGIKSLYGRATISYSDTENRNQYAGTIYYKIRDSLFIKIEGLVGETEAVVFLRPDSFFVENYYDKFVVRDLRENFTLRRVLGLDIPFEDLKYSLYGFEPISDDFIISEMNDEYLILKNPITVNRWQEIKLNKNLVIEEVKGFVNEQVDYIKQYDYFFYENEHYLPRRIVFKKLNPLGKLMIFFENLELDRYHKPEYFKQDIK